MKEMIVALLMQALALPKETNLMLWFGHRFTGTPYVAQTLEVNATESLVVNVKEMDCTTFVETCLALTMTALQGSADYDDYCRNLTRIRYRGGVLDGYASRNHYFTQWITSNEALGIVEEIQAPEGQFAATQTIALNYMSKHPSYYPMLKGDKGAQRLIRAYEEEASGATVRYIPHRLLGGDRESLSAVRDGDILAIVTRKEGLDTSHLGIAEWGDDGRLHLLNASQIHKKVVLEPMTLSTYMSKHPSQLGVRVIRLKQQ